MTEIILLDQPLAITLNESDEVLAVSLTDSIIQIGGESAGSQRYTHPIANITQLTITANQHQIAQPSTVTVCETNGSVVWVDTIIDPVTGSVSISAMHPVTGYVLIG